MDAKADLPSANHSNFVEYGGKRVYKDRNNAPLWNTATRSRLKVAIYFNTNRIVSNTQQLGQHSRFEGRTQKCIATL